MPKPSFVATSVPTPPSILTPGKRARTSREVTVEVAEKAKSERLEANNIGQFFLMFTLSHTVDVNHDVNHELRPFPGLYNRIGTLNGKPL